MKSKNMGVLVLVLVLGVLLSLPVPSSAAKYGLRLFAGYGRFAAEEANKGIQGFADYWRTLAVVSSGFTASGEYEPFHYGPDVGGELLFYFSPLIGLGLSGCYMEAGSQATIDLTKTGASSAIGIKPKISAIPVRASLYLTIPVAAFLNVSLHGGLGYYFARITSDVVITEGSNFVEFYQEANGRDLGFHGGLGLEININPTTAVVIEGQARMAKVDDFEGSATTSTPYSEDTEEGTLYYLVSHETIGTFPVIYINDSPPIGPGVSDVHKATIDFSGITVRASLLLRF